MKKEGAIVLGIGGDDGQGAVGTSSEGVMASGHFPDPDEKRRPGRRRHRRPRKVLDRG